MIEATKRRLEELNVCLDSYMTIYPQLAELLLSNPDTQSKDLQAVYGIVKHIQIEIERLSAEVRKMEIENGLTPTISDFNNFKELNLGSR